jgi:hypothetical protein
MASATMTFPCSRSEATVLLPTSRRRTRRGDPQAASGDFLYAVPTLCRLSRERGGAGRVRTRTAVLRLGRRGRCRPRSAQRWRERYGVDILDGLGSTEMLHIF